MGPDPYLEKPRATGAPLRVFCSVNCGCPRVYNAKQEEVVKRAVPCIRSRNCAHSMRSLSLGKSVNMAHSLPMTPAESNIPISPTGFTPPEVLLSVHGTVPADPDPSSSQTASDVEPDPEVSGGSGCGPRLVAGQKRIIKRTHLGHMKYSRSRKKTAEPTTGPLSPEAVARSSS